MNLYIAFILSFIIGLLLTTRYVHYFKSVHPFLFIFLSFGVGLGISVQIVFYSFIIFNQYSVLAITAGNLLCALILTGLHLKAKTSPMSVKKIFHQNPLNLFDYAALTLFLIAGYILFTLAITHPYGYWDAWAVWNMKYKFLLTAQDSWQNLFALHWHTQPDYPLFLPLINVWAQIFAANQFHATPLATGVLFTLFCGGFLYSALAGTIDKRIALLASSLLLFLPPVNLIGTSQYADVVLSYYLLAVLVSLTLALKENNQGLLIITGMLLGFLTFIKNEGIAIAILLLLITARFLSRNNKKDTGSLMPCILVPFFIAVIPTLIFKVFLTLPNRDLFLTQWGTKFEFFNFSSFLLIGRHLFSSMMDPNFHFFWLLLIIMFCLRPREYFRNEASCLTVFFCSYLMVVFIIYLTTINFDLQWRLMRTFPRILIYQIPSLIFLHFYVHWQKNDQAADNSSKYTLDG